MGFIPCMGQAASVLLQCDARVLSPKNNFLVWSASTPPPSSDAKLKMTVMRSRSPSQLVTLCKFSLPRKTTTVPASITGACTFSLFPLFTTWFTKSVFPALSCTYSNWPPDKGCCSTRLKKNSDLSWCHPIASPGRYLHRTVSRYTKSVRHITGSGATDS